MYDHNRVLVFAGRQWHRKGAFHAATFDAGNRSVSSASEIASSRVTSAGVFLLYGFVLVFLSRCYLCFSLDNALVSIALLYSLHFFAF